MALGASPDQEADQGAHGRERAWSGPSWLRRTPVGIKELALPDGLAGLLKQLD